MGRPRLVWHFPWQDPTSRLNVYVDTDFAGCLKTRRSTSGGLGMVGCHSIKAWSATQTVVALSNGEAELSGLVKGAAQAMGLRSVAADLGLKWDIVMHSDATAAIGICRRRGLGKIRHLAVAHLWIQDKLKSHEFGLEKVLGALNPADLLTKYLDGAVQDGHVERMGLKSEGGRAATAPKLPKNDGGGGE